MCCRKSGQASTENSEAFRGAGRLFACRGLCGSAQDMVGEYHEQAEDADLCQVQQGEVGCAMVRHGFGRDQPKEKWARIRNTPKMPAWTMSSHVKVTERRRRVVVCVSMMVGVGSCLLCFDRYESFMSKPIPEAALYKWRHSPSKWRPWSGPA